MARHSDEFLIAWSSLSGTGHEDGWQTISIASAGPLQLSAGRRAADDCEAVLVGFTNVSLGTAIKLPEGQGFAVERVSTDDRSMLWLALTRKRGGSSELFLDMACNVTGALDEAVVSGTSMRNLLGVFIGRVGAWQEFMRRGTQAISPEAEIGLVGELYTLLEIIKAGVPTSTALDAWVGPLNGVQDFQLGTGAFEVKSTLASTGFPAHIGSLDQLDNATRQPLFVVGIRLSQKDVGLGLPDLVHASRIAVELDTAAASALDDRLVAAGYFDTQANRYSRRFTLAGITLVEVTEGFPRLTIGAVPPGIHNATYEIDLDKAPGMRIDIMAALQKLGVI